MEKRERKNPKELFNGKFKHMLTIYILKDNLWSKFQSEVKQACEDHHGLQAKESCYVQSLFGK